MCSRALLLLFSRPVACHQLDADRVWQLKPNSVFSPGLGTSSWWQHSTGVESSEMEIFSELKNAWENNYCDEFPPGLFLSPPPFTVFLFFYFFSPLRRKDRTWDLVKVNVLWLFFLFLWIMSKRIFIGKFCTHFQWLCRKNDYQLQIYM